MRWSRVPTVQVVQKTLEIPLVLCSDSVVSLLVVVRVGSEGAECVRSVEVVL